MIRIQQRNGRKTLTTVQGIHEKFDKKTSGARCVCVCVCVIPSETRFTFPHCVCLTILTLACVFPSVCVHVYSFTHSDTHGSFLPVLFVHVCVLWLQEFACNGTVVQHPEYGEVIQLTGDQRNNIYDFLLQVGFCTKDQLKLHGF